MDVDNIILILVLLILSALFSSAETSFSGVNKIRLKNYAEKGDKRASKALKIANSFENALTAILIGNNIVNIAMSSLATVIFTNAFGAKGVAIATTVITVVVLIFGEILPKTYAKSNAEKIALSFASPLSIFMIIMKPFIFIFNSISKIFKNNESEPSVTEAELKYIIDEIEEQGVLEENESDLVRSALEFDETTVNQILIPRVKVVGVEKNATIDEIKNLFLEEMYSRLPVYDKSLDNIIGIITNKNFFKMLNDGKSEIGDIIQKVAHISDLKFISEALKEMQVTKTHMAIVMDQYGGTKGIITMEDIIEELVGEIYDEDDEIEESLKKIDENVYEVSGNLSISDMLEKLDLPNDLIESSYTSIGGWVTEILQHIPEEGEKAKVGIFEVLVIKVYEQSVKKIQLQIMTSENESVNL